MAPLAINIFLFILYHRSQGMGIKFDKKVSPIVRCYHFIDPREFYDKVHQNVIQCSHINRYKYAKMSKNVEKL